MSEPLKISRRGLLAAAPAAALALGAPHTLAAEQPTVKKKKIAAIATVMFKLSHTEVIVDRFLEGFGWGSEHHRPDLDLVSLYMDQTPAGDLSRERADRRPEMKIYPTIAEALCLGGDKLAVDGVVLIGEHGNYPVNEKGQTLYPRYEFFKQTVDVFRKSGRSVPVFNDKHLSWSWDRSREMFDTAASMGFPFMAGSSLPVTWRIPELELPLDCELTEVMAIGNGNVDSYDFHALETIQCMVERRKGGETGVVRLQALRGDAVWKAMRQGTWDQGGWDPALLEACLCRSQQLVPAREGFSHVYPTADDLARMVKSPVAYRITYADGLKATMLLLNGLVGDITFSARVKGEDEPRSTLLLLGGDQNNQPHNFDALVYQIEQFIKSGKSPTPLERTLLTSGLVTAGVESLFRGSEELSTPHLAIRYRPSPVSIYRRS